MRTHLEIESWRRDSALGNMTSDAVQEFYCHQVLKTLLTAHFPKLVRLAENDQLKDGIVNYRLFRWALDDDDELSEQDNRVKAFTTVFNSQLVADYTVGTLRN